MQFLMQFFYFNAVWRYYYDEFWKESRWFFRDYGLRKLSRQDHDFWKDPRWFFFGIMDLENVHDRIMISEKIHAGFSGLWILKTSRQDYDFWKKSRCSFFGIMDFENNHDRIMIFENIHDGFFRDYDF